MKITVDQDPPRWCTVEQFDHLVSWIKAFPFLGVILVIERVEIRKW